MVTATTNLAQVVNDDDDDLSTIKQQEETPVATSSCRRHFLPHGQRRRRQQFHAATAVAVLLLLLLLCSILTTTTITTTRVFVSGFGISATTTTTLMSTSIKIRTTSNNNSNKNNHKSFSSSRCCCRMMSSSSTTTDNDGDSSSNNNNNIAPPCVIKVLGVGGGGGNAVNRMIQSRIEGVSFWAINTDAQALSCNLAQPNVLNIGRSITRGLGAGGDPKVGAAACLENVNDIREILEGVDMVFITAGMGGGTGSGAAPIVAEIAKQECHALTVGVVTRPFMFEGRKRSLQADAAIRELQKQVDTLIVVSNDKLLRIVPDNTPVTDAFLVADDILQQGVVGITEIILKTGLVNVDFADVRAVMRDAGTALMGVGSGVGKTRAADAAVAAISSPLLDFPIRQAQRIVFNVVGGPTMGLSEINAASEVIYENAHEDANIIFGALIDETMGEEVSITVLACDFRKDDDIDTPATTAADTSSSSGVAISSSASRLAAAAVGQSSGSSSESSSSENNINNERRDPNFYKTRRQMTTSPLGPNASVEEARIAIKRGFKKPTEDPPPEKEDDCPTREIKYAQYDDNDKQAKGFKQRLRNLFRFGRK